MSTSKTEKPKHLTDAEKGEVTGTDAGWTAPAGGNGNPNADREVLVTIRGASTPVVKKPTPSEDNE